MTIATHRWINRLARPLLLPALFLPALVALNALTLPSARADAPDLTYKSWTDPSEKAFTLQLPDGWNASGGLTRNGDSNFRQSVQAFVNDNDLLVQIGDAGLPPFIAPTPELAQAGLTEGSLLSSKDGVKILVMSYLPTLKFNDWYASKRMAPIMDNITLGYSHQEKDLADRYTAELQKVSQVPVSVTVGETSFTGRLKQNGHDVMFVLFSVVLHTGTPGNGDETWLARPIMMGWAVNDQAAANRAEAGAVLTHMLSTWQDSPGWIATYDQSQASKPGAGKPGASPGQRASIVGTYWKMPAARDESVKRLMVFLDKVSQIPAGTPVAPTDAPPVPFVPK